MHWSKKGLLVAIAITGLAISGCTDQSSSTPTHDGVASAESYLKNPPANKANACAGKEWSCGIVLRTWYSNDGFGPVWKMTVLQANGTRANLESSSEESADALHEDVSPGDFVAFKGGSDKRVLSNEVKILETAAVTVS